MKALPVTATAAATLPWLYVAPALAAAKGENTPVDLGSDAPAQSGGGGLVRTVVGLAVVLGVIYGLHWVLKQVKASKEGRASGAGLESVSSLPLGSGRSIHVIRAGREVLVVGAGEHGVTPVRAYAADDPRGATLLSNAEALDGTAVELTEQPALPAPETRRTPLEQLRAWTVRG